MQVAKKVKLEPWKYCIPVPFGFWSELFARLHTQMFRLMYWLCQSVCQHLNICLNIKKTAIGIHNFYIDVHLDMTFQMRLYLETLTMAAWQYRLKDLFIILFFVHVLFCVYF